MNRYVRDGLLADMRAGKRVLLIAENYRHVGHCLETLHQACWDSETVRPSRGNEKISSRLGGWVRILSARSEAYRGLTVDVVFIDADISPERLAVITPCAAVGGEVIFP